MRNDFTYPETGETVERERWTWIACFSDGTELHQFDEATGIFHRFAEIDQSKLAHFKMTNGDRVLTLIFNPSEMKLIHFYKNYGLNFGTDEFEKIKLYVFGYEKVLKSGTIRNLQVILENDEVVTTDDLGNLGVA